MTESKHTPGTIRAAEIICQGGPYLHTPFTVATLAEIIDRETAAPKLLEALTLLLWQVDGMNGGRHAGINLLPAAWVELSRLCNIARVAIAKAGGSQL